MRFVVIGSGKTAIDIVRIIAREPRATVAATAGDPRRETAQSSLRAEAEKRGLPYHGTATLGDGPTLGFLEAAQPDYVISANNFLLFRKSTLEIPRFGTINFHNGPLPSYAGVNPFCWAIINGETSYGITWHLVDEGIDSGAILHFEPFAVEADETAVKMVVKCVQAGIRSFQTTVLPGLLANNLGAKPQAQDGRRYYSQKDLPYGGFLPWWLTQEAIRPLVRALAFSPLPNLFYRPQILLPENRTLHCDQVEFMAGTSRGSAGAITALDGASLQVSVDGGEIIVRSIYESAIGATAVDPMSIGLSVGQSLRQPVIPGVSL